MDNYCSAQSQILEYIADLSGLEPSAKIPFNSGYSIAVGVTKSSQRFFNHKALLCLPVIFFGKANTQVVLMNSLSKLCETLTSMHEFTKYDGFEIADISVSAYPSLVDTEPNGMFIWSCTLSVLYYTK